MKVTPRVAVSQPGSLAVVVVVLFVRPDEIVHLAQPVDVRLGLVWCGVVWCGAVWFGLVWFGLV